MKQNTARWWVILAAVLVVYNAVAFAVPFPKNGVFFLSWGFTLIAIAAQVYVIRTALLQGEGVKSKFYGFPIAKLGVMYLAAQLVLGLVFMALGFALTVPVWVPLVLYVVLLGASVVGFVAADAVRAEVTRQDVKLAKDVSRMRALQSKVASMPQLTQDARIHQVIKKLSEDLQFSDPVSSDALKEIEGDLNACIDELQEAVMSNDREAVFALAQKAGMVLVERNRLCKLDKRSAH